MESCGKTCQYSGVIGGVRADLDNLKGWQKKQNGSILRVEAKLDKLIFWAMTAAVGFILTLVGAVIFFVAGI